MLSLPWQCLQRFGIGTIFYLAYCGDSLTFSYIIRLQWVWLFLLVRSGHVPCRRTVGALTADCRRTVGALTAVF